MYRNLDAEMKRNNITRGNLASALHITASTMSLKLNGKSNISLKEAAAIKKIVGTEMPLEELFRPFAEKEKVSA